MAKDIREFAWVAAPKLLGAGAQLVLNLVLVRALGLDQFGIVAVCLSVIILTDAVVGAAFDAAVLRQAPVYLVETPARSLQVQQAGLLLKMAMGLLAAIPIVLLGNWLNLILFQGRGSRSLLYLSALSVLGLLMLRSVQTHFQVSRRFRSYGMSDLLNNFIRYGGTALLVLLRDATPWRVIALHALAPLVVTLVLLATLARPLLLVAPSAQAIHEVLHLIRSYLPTAAVGSVTSRIDLFFVTTFASVAQAGIFAAAQTLIIAPQMIGMYLAVVFSPRIMPLWNAGELRGPYLRFQRAAFALSVAGYAVALFTFGPFVHAFLPRTFHAAIIVALILLPAGLSALVNFPWTVSFLLFLRPNFLLKFDLFALPILAVLYVFAVRSFGAAGAAAVTAAYALVKTVALQTVANGILAGAEPSGQLVSSLGDKQVATIG